MIRILLDDIEAKSDEEVQQKCCAWALQAGVKATFTDIFPQRVFGYASTGYHVYSAHAEFDSLEDAKAFMRVWLGFDASDEELEENMMFV
jgi:hypothetical protein